MSQSQPRFTGVQPWDAMVNFDNGRKYFQAPFVLAIAITEDPKYPFNPIREVRANDMVPCRVQYLLQHPNNKIGKNRVVGLTCNTLDIVVFGVDLNDTRDCACVAKSFTIQANQILHRSNAKNPVNFRKRFEHVDMAKWRWCQYYRENKIDG